MKYPMIRLSHSSADRFFTCPESYRREKLAKDVPYLETEATLWGSRVHSSIESYIKGEQVDFATLMMTDVEPVITWLREFPADHKAVEQEWAFNTKGEICAFNDPEAMFGGYTDFESVTGSNGFVCDFKTGKRHSKYEQVELYALSLWLRFPQVNEVRAGYMWLKERDPNTFLSFKTLYRSTDMDRIWKYRVEQYNRIKAAHETGVFPATPGKGRSKFPCGWCGAAKAGCDYSNVEYMAK